MGHVGPLGRTKFHVNGYTGKSGKFPLFGKVAPQGEPFGQFLQLLGLFMRPTTLRRCFKFDMIRLIDYGVIAKKPRVCHLPRNFPCTP